MNEITYKLEIKIEGIHHETVHGGTEIDLKKWKKIADICNERKASIYELINEYLEELTPERAEEILFSWDI